ncbi:MAG: MFS transporter [Beijerinckiaceae bacterium]
MRLGLDQTRGIVAALGTTQTIAWASTYYLPAILANSIAKDMGVSPVLVFTAFSLSLIVLALVGPLGGRLIDRHGGREVLLASNAIFVAGLLLLAASNHIAVVFVAWVVIGLGMGIGLYESAFATLAVYYGKEARRSITGITLIAGFASTVGWPLTALMEAQYGWRVACIGWALIHLLLAAPLNFLLPGKPVATAEGADIAAGKNTPETAEASAAESAPPPRYLVPLLAFIFAVGGFASTAMSAHLPRLLEAAGATTAVAVSAGALIGFSQVAARILEYRFMQGFHPLISARLAVLSHPIGACLLMLFGGPAAYIFTVFYGAGNGIMTIVKGTLPLALMGPKNYGYVQGLISAPARFLQAFAPILFGYAIEVMGGSAVWITAGLSLSAFVALMFLSARTSER